MAYISISLDSFIMFKPSLERVSRELSNDILDVLIELIYTEGQAVEGGYPHLGTHTRHCCGCRSTGMGLAWVWVQGLVWIPVGIPAPMPNCCKHVLDGCNRW